MPGVIPKVNQVLACSTQLSNQIVLVNCGSRKIGPCVDKRWQGPSRQSLQSLERGGWGVRHERQQECFLRCLNGGFIQDRNIVVEQVSLLAFGIGYEGDGKVISQSIDYNYNGLIKRLLVPASFITAPACPRRGGM